MWTTGRTRREGPGMSLLRLGLGRWWPHLEETHISWHAAPGPSSGSACWGLSSLMRLVITILHDSEQPRLPPRWPEGQYSVGAGVDPTPRLECGCQNPESISSFLKN